MDGTGQYGTLQFWWLRAVDGTGQYGTPQFWWRRAVDGTGQYGTPQFWWRRAVDGTGQYGTPQFWWRRAVLLQYHDVVPSRVLLFDAVGSRFIAFKHQNTALRNK